MMSLARSRRGPRRPRTVSIARSIAHSLRSLGPILLLAAMLAGCSVNPSTGRRQLILVSSDQTAAMGVEAMPGLVQEFGGEVASPQVRAYVDRVGQRLLTQVEPQFAGIQWEFTALNSDVVNAFALPGGKIFITVGLMSRFDNEAQVAAVLGHEIGHVTGKHIDERISQTLVTQLGLQVLSASTETAVIAEGASMLAQGSLLKFGRDQESESDAQGLKYMTAAGYDPTGMAQVLQVLAEAASGPRPPEILASHPHPENRLRIVQSALQGPYAFAVASPQHTLAADRFQRELAPLLRR